MATERNGSPASVSIRDTGDDDLPAIEALHRQAFEGTVRYHSLFDEFD